MCDDFLNTEFVSIAEDLGINPKNVVHFLLVGGLELVGEILDQNNDDDSDSTTSIANPVKILRDAFVSEDGYEAHHFFVDWNPCGENPIIHLNSQIIISQSTPNKITLEMYLSSVHNTYYPFDITFEPSFDSAVSVEDTKKVVDDNNVIDFIPYLIKNTQDTL